MTFQVHVRLPILQRTANVLSMLVVVVSLGAVRDRYYFIDYS